MIGIIDVGMGNIGSLNSAIYQLGHEVSLVSTDVELIKCHSIILPGVGSFPHGMQAIRNANLIEPIFSHVIAGKPLLGICLGMQMLFNTGQEGVECDGLGLIPGKVRRFSESLKLQIPHVGWNEVKQVKRHKLWQGIKLDVDFYFVHSYHALCEERFVIGETCYGEYFPSVVGKDNVIGIQFHPEKSQRNGLKVLDNFCNWDGKC